MSRRMKNDLAADAWPMTAIRVGDATNCSPGVGCGQYSEHSIDLRSTSRYR
jgi:hypothetical protein